MSQEIFDIIDPSISGTELAEKLDDFKNALMTGCSGTSRPAELDLGGGWIDTTDDPTTWSYKIWTGTDDVEVFRINLDSGIASVALTVEDFSVKKVSADTAGALLKLVKQRIANNGQVLSGDTVGEIQLIGRGNDSSNPVVAKIVWVASDDQTSSAFGGELAFYSTPDASATITKHMRLIDGLVETLVPLKVNSVQPVSQNVATSASINQLSADNMVVEMTGSTATDLRGIDSEGNTKQITIHNRSSAVVTLKHENSSATSEDRLKLPDSSDLTLDPDTSATLFYCTADSRWKLVSVCALSGGFSGFTKETYYNSASWTAPSTAVRVRAYRKQVGHADTHAIVMDNFGNLYAWGKNVNGELGLGDVTPRSSPVAVLGGLQFSQFWSMYENTSAMSRYGIATNGNLYAWGANGNGELGLGDVTPRSSPVAVLGAIKFIGLTLGFRQAYGIATNGDLYAWGVNDNGELGVGNVTPRSSPVAVLGGLKFSRISPVKSDFQSVLALTTAGAAYGWGENVSGQLGLGDVTPRSSPVAVLGGLTFVDIKTHARSVIALTAAGAAYGWGLNNNGQLGLGDVTPRSSPVAVLGGLTFKQIIRPSGNAVFALTAAGAAYAWGVNTKGILGVGDNNARSSPVAVLGGLTFKKLINPRGTSVFGITEDGTAYAWGTNDQGELGVGDRTARSSPVAVVGGLKFSDIWSTANSGYMGVTLDGQLYAWGQNSFGEAGVGDVTSRSSPVAVLGSICPNIAETTYTTYLDVTVSGSYDLKITDGLSYFAGISLGLNVYKVELEYI